MRLIEGWREPVAVAAGIADRTGALCLLSDGGPRGRWSYVACEPETLEVLPTAAADFADLRGRLRPSVAEAAADRPPFRGGVVGLAAYDLGAPPHRAVTDAAWPPLALGRYDTLLAFDHHQRRVVALGDADRATAWLDAAGPASGAALRGGRLAEAFEAEADDETYLMAVADVVRRIGEGELFQANIARAWSGRLAAGVDPFDLFLRLAGRSPAPYAAFWRLPDRALVSNSPEAFVALDAAGRLETRPIKGTRPRGGSEAEDASLGRDLIASAKDRAENLMIVDLMRNDLARVARPGSVRVDGLFDLERFANVQHLVSTVSAELAPGCDAAHVMAAAFPPGSITGAPKHQAMKVIAGHEAPRGPWCGSLFAAGDDGSLAASVLIRTVALTRDGDGWRFRTLAGAGIVADSDPQGELDETDAKIDAIRRALTEP